MDWQAVSLFHVTSVTSAPWNFSRGGLLVGWLLFFVCFHLGSFSWRFLTSSSRGMTATVSSNAALEKTFVTPS